MTAPAIPLVQQIEEVRFSVVRQRSLLTGASIRELRKPAIAEHGLERLEAAVRTLEILNRNADEIRAFLKLPAETRVAALEYGQADNERRAAPAQQMEIMTGGGPDR